jgi:hypothetical protein
MKKGYLGPYQLGALDGASEALQLAAEVTKQRSTDLDAVFYASAFQAGVDEFVILRTMGASEIRGRNSSQPGRAMFPRNARSNTMNFSVGSLLLIFLKVGGQKTNS